jgi:CheY-like chemotaxis protein
MKRVLIADPDSSLALLYAEVLERSGYEVKLTTSGLDCLARLRSFRPDVLVLDPNLPWGGGDGVLALMQEESLEDAQVILLSAVPAALAGCGARVRSRQFTPLTPLRLVGIVREITTDTQVTPQDSSSAGRA